MSPKLLLLIPTLLLLSACETAAHRAGSFTGVPLADWPKAEQAQVAAKITQACGSPPVCPGDAVLERAALAYAKLRALVRAATP